MKMHHLLVLIPFIGMLGGSLFVNIETPYVLGIPFTLFWIVLWIVLGSGIMTIIYKLDSINKEGDTE